MNRIAGESRGRIFTRQMNREADYTQGRLIGMQVMHKVGCSSGGTFAVQVHLKAGYSEHIGRGKLFAADRPLQVSRGRSTAEK